MNIDVVLGLSFGDEGKGKICHSLLSKNKYTHVLRFNGGHNAGHTIYHDNKKLITHIIPSGVFYGIKSVIGPGCVVNIAKFFEEMDYLKQNGINTDGLVFIAKNAHIIQDSHLEEDGSDTAIGTTRTGNGPAYRDKYGRDGKRAEECEQLKPYLIDMYQEFYNSNNRKIKILAEGAQAFHLDIDWGDYPYVTSSHCGIGSVLLNGFSHKNIRNIYGVIKAYDTYVGAKDFQPKDNIFEHIQQEGQEFGATTGRKRKCNWLNWDNIKKSIVMNGVNNLIVNKVDILQKVEQYRIIYNGSILNFVTVEKFQEFIRRESHKLGAKVYFSYSPYDCDFSEEQQTVYDNTNELRYIDRYI